MGQRYPSCFENQITVVGSSSFPVFCPAEEDRQHQCMTGGHQTIPALGSPWDGGWFVSRGTGLCFVIPPSGRWPSFAGRHSGSRGVGVSSEPSKAWAGLDVVEGFRGSECGALRAHWAFCACADQPKQVWHYPKAFELLAHMLVGGSACADCWVPNWDSFPGRERACVWRRWMYGSLLSKNVPENGKRMKE